MDAVTSPAEKDTAAHEPIDVWYMPDDETQESLLRAIADGSARLMMRVCEACAPYWVLAEIDNCTLDESDGDALAAQWPCKHVVLPRKTDAP